MTWTPDCSCGHEQHIGLCPVVTCGHYQKPKECSICAPHPPHDGRQCFALGVREPCPCGPGVASKDHLDEIWIERNRWRTPQWH